MNPGIPNNTRGGFRPLLVVDPSVFGADLRELAQPGLDRRVPGHLRVVVGVGDDRLDAPLARDAIAELATERPHPAAWEGD